MEAHCWMVGERWQTTAESKTRDWSDPHGSSCHSVLVKLVNILKHKGRSKSSNKCSRESKVSLSHHSLLMVTEPELSDTLEVKIQPQSSFLSDGDWAWTARYLEQSRFSLSHHFFLMLTEPELPDILNSQDSASVIIPFWCWLSLNCQISWTVKIQPQSSFLSDVDWAWTFRYLEQSRFSLSHHSFLMVIESALPDILNSQRFSLSSFLSDGDWAWTARYLEQLRTSYREVCHNSLASTGIKVMRVTCLQSDKTWP